MKTIFAATLCLGALTACSHQPAAEITPASHAIDRRLTLRGRIEEGKLGPFVRWGNAPVYLNHEGSTRSGTKLQSLHGKTVSVSGILRYRHFAQHPDDQGYTARASDYFYLEPTTVTVVE